MLRRTWGRSGLVGFFLSRGILGGAIVWGRNVGAVVTNITEVRRRACGFPATG